MLTREILFYPEFWHDFVPRFETRTDAIDFLVARIPGLPNATARSIFYRVGMRGERLDGHRSRPAGWSWTWPAPPYPGMPSIPGLPAPLAGGERLLQSSRRSARDSAILANVGHPEPGRPRDVFQTPDGFKAGNVISDATGDRIGDEIAVRHLDPVFEDHQVPRDAEGLIDGFVRAQREKKLHDQSQRKARIDMRHIDVPICIMLHTDVHHGSEDTDYDAIRRHFRLLRETPFLYAFGGGDFNEFAKLKHRGAVDGQIHVPTVQARATRAIFVETWRKWLAVVLGNHDMRVWLESGFDIGDFLLGEPPEGESRIPFMRDGGLVVVELGGQVYTHNLFHGDSAFGTRFNENHKGRQTARLVDGRTDCVWNGHTHNPAIQDTNEPSDDMAGARDACYLQGGTYKVLGDDHAVRRKYLMVEDVQMPAVIQFPDMHLTLPFKRVETAVMVHQMLVAAYRAGNSVRDVLPHLLDR